MLLEVIAFLIAVAAAAPPPSINVIKYPNDYDVQILRYENNDLGKGSYSFAFEQSDGTRHEQQGELKNEGLEDEYIVMRGSYSWVGPDGVTYTVSYVADENGFEPRVEQGPGGALPPHLAAV